MRSWKRNWVIFLSRFKHGFEIDKYNVHWSLLWYLDLCLAKPFLDLHDFPQRSYRMEIPVMWFASMWSLIWFLSTHFTYSYSSLAFVRISIVTEYHHLLDLFFQTLNVCVVSCVICECYCRFKTGFNNSCFHWFILFQFAWAESIGQLLLL